MTSVPMEESREVVVLAVGGLLTLALLLGTLLALACWGAGGARERYWLVGRGRAFAHISYSRAARVEVV